MSDSFRFNAMAAEAHANSAGHGWWDSCRNTDGSLDTFLVKRTVPEKIALMHSELSEGLEDYRNGSDLVALQFDECHADAAETGVDHRLDHPRHFVLGHRPAQVFQHQQALHALRPALFAEQVPHRDRHVDGILALVHVRPQIAEVHIEADAEARALDDERFDHATTTGILPMRACHSRGPVWCTDVPVASTATVTGMSCTVNS